MQISILGLGEVGRTFAQIEKEAGHEVFTKDLDHNGLKKSAVLHICLPFSDQFFTASQEAISESEPELVIIHSTVPVGTTRKLSTRVKTTETVHSPIRGMHPNLAPGVKTFVKFVGPVTIQGGQLAENHLQKLKIKTALCRDAETTEFAKLYDTLYYAWNIVFCKELYKTAQQAEVDFKQAYTLWNQTYNDGYTKLGKPNVLRPVLTPQPGPIGGHCLIPNATMAFKQFKDALSQFVLGANSTCESDHQSN
ncbi:hypothetical protein L6258_00810 [Candidatus Parcubacteria bacterium]|nr:hypothetical protein [Candidatus Parcubacteria bacterium]